MIETVDLSFPSPEENLACDEALLEWREREGGEGILRFWESPVPFVVVGYANKMADEVRLEACRRDAVPVMRRVSGGGSVVQGPGCLNFSLVLPIDSAPELQGISSTNTFVTERNAAVLATVLGDEVAARGLSDLTIGSLKFSGNAQRRKRHFVLFHGTFLLEFDIPRVTRALAIPARQPEYRAGRAHEAFLTNAGVSRAGVKSLLAAAWGATAQLSALPLEEIRRLARSRYQSADWTFRW